MVTSHIIIWMSIFNNRVVRRAEVWGLLGGGLWEAEVLCSDICVSMKDKWWGCWSCKLTCFYFCCSSSLQPFTRAAELSNKIILQIWEHLSSCLLSLCPGKHFRSWIRFESSNKQLPGSWSCCLGSDSGYADVGSDSVIRQKQLSKQSSLTFPKYGLITWSILKLPTLDSFSTDFINHKSAFLISVHQI